MTTEGWARLRRRWVRIAIVVPGSVAALLGVTYGVERSQLVRHQGGTSVRLAAPDPFLRVDGPGLTRPPARAADLAGLGDDEPVIGVVVAGAARAYRVAALGTRTTHVVNDMVGGTPVTVAYCDIDRCARAYADPGGSRPLAFRVGGLYTMEGAQLVLDLGGTAYFQRTGRPVLAGVGPDRIPYMPLTLAQTTWGEWRRLHPATDVFVGDPPANPE